MQHVTHKGLRSPSIGGNPSPPFCGALCDVAGARDASLPCLLTLDDAAVDCPVCREMTEIARAGLAHLAELAEERRRGEQLDLFGGAPAYTSPEQDARASAASASLAGRGGGAG